MMNKWAKEFGIPYPKCRMTGQCCKCATPSTSAVELLKKASENNDFAKDFFSVFIPYRNIEEAQNINPGWVKRCFESCRKPNSKVSEQDLYFYHCRYISEDNKCLVWEDRPQFCRDYPDSPFLVTAPGCAYEEWSKLCREKYKNLQIQLHYLKQAKKELEGLKYQQRAINLLAQIQRVNNKDYNFMFLVPSMCLISPGKSWIKIL
jgi:Fe-S-cluster containining protein